MSLYITKAWHLKCDVYLKKKIVYPLLLHYPVHLQSRVGSAFYRMAFFSCCVQDTCDCSLRMFELDNLSSFSHQIQTNLGVPNH